MVGGEPIVVLKRTIGRDGLSSYHSGSRYIKYNDCDEKILEIARKSLALLNIEMGSLDIIEINNGECIVIDVNSTSNFSEDNLEFLEFNPMENMAEFIAEKYRSMEKNKGTVN
jgi:glutathione synthase/RimK-type ligase-like ATP-grasp enzyme